jgi:hypothetical protein
MIRPAMAAAPPFESKLPHHPMNSRFRLALLYSFRLFAIIGAGDVRIPA